MTDGVFDITTGNKFDHAEESIDTDTVAMQIFQIQELIAAIES
tara:strand:+ start:232 stop:360 length:129 start_codon:yes stop_codon:yes gene_type:complete